MDGAHRVLRKAARSAQMRAGSPHLRADGLLPIVTLAVVTITTCLHGGWCWDGWDGLCRGE